MEQLRVLVVDDEDHQAESLRAFMEKNGFLTDKETDPYKVRTRVQQNKYDAILLDIVMPDYDGIDVLVDIKTFSPSSKVIMMTGEATRTQAAETMRLGASAFIDKDPSVSSQAYVDNAKEVIGSPPVHEQSALRERLIRYLWHRAQHGESQLRGRDLEGLMKLIFESVDGFEDVETNIRIGTGEEIDVEFENRRSDPFWSKWGVLIRAECKNWSKKKVAPEQYAFFRDKLKLGGFVQLGFLISHSGFSEATRKLALTTAREGPLTVLIDYARLKQLVEEQEREKLLRKFVKEAMRLRS